MSALTSLTCRACWLALEIAQILAIDSLVVPLGARGLSGTGAFAERDCVARTREAKGLGHN
jgi:hypothetical protein